MGDSATKKLEKIDPEREYSLAKVPGGDWFRDELYSTDHSTYSDREKISKLAKKHGNRLKIIHNHSSSDASLVTLPGKEDYADLLLQPGVRTSIVSQHNPDTNKVEGYFFVRKTKKSPKIKPPSQEFYKLAIKNQREEFSEETQQKLSDYYDRYIERSGFKPIVQNMERYGLGKPNYSGTLAFCKSEGLQFRAVPVKGFYFDKSKGKFIKKGELENRVTAAISVLSLIGTILLFSSNLTGNVVGTGQTSSNWIGGILFIIGLIGAFAYLRRK